MSHTLKIWFSKFGASFLLAGMVMAASVGQSTHAQSPCDTQLMAGESCTILFTANNPGGSFTFIGPSGVAVGSVGSVDPHIGAFSFDGTVLDQRLGTAGWTLSAFGALASPSTGGTAPIHMNGSAAGPGNSDASTNVGTPQGPQPPAACGTTHVHSVALPAANPGVEFANADPLITPTTNAVDCSYALHIGGYVDFDSQPAAADYAGDATITLASV
jgi:hypothetical protein